MSEWKPEVGNSNKLYQKVNLPDGDVMHITRLDVQMVDLLVAQLRVQSLMFGKSKNSHVRLMVLAEIFMAGMLARMSSNPPASDTAMIDEFAQSLHRRMALMRSMPETFATQRH